LDSIPQPTQHPDIAGTWPVDDAIGATQLRHVMRPEQIEGLRTTTPDQPTAVVLAGAGARGAYEAGLVAELLPQLKDTRPRIFVGTSTGAINAVLLASLAHLSAEDARQQILDRWRVIDSTMVLGPAWISILKAAAQYVGALAGFDGPSSLLDTGPLRHSLTQRALIDWDQVNDNIRAGHVQALAVVATECGSGRTKVFYQTNSDDVRPGAKGNYQAIDYVRVDRLTPEHARASAAIPVIFPPVQLGSSKQKRFYIDGGVRLNAPLKPAIDFGAQGVLVVSTDSRRYGMSEATDGRRPPSMQDQVLQIMRGAFADRMIEDVQVLLDQNRTILHALQSAEGPTIGDKRYIPLIFGGPTSQEEVRGVAAGALAEVLRGGRGLRHINFALLNLLTSVSPYSRPDLLSYVLFEPEFIHEALNAGMAAAGSLLEDNPRPDLLWHCLDRRDDAAGDGQSFGSRPPQLPSSLAS
jgi:NTE family protein